MSKGRFKKTQPSGRSTIAKPHYMSTAELKEGFLHHRSPEIRARSATTLERRGAPQDKYTAAQMWIEIARDPSLDVVAKHETLDRAAQLLELLRLRPSTTSETAVKVGGRATLELASWSLMQWLICGERVAPKADIESAYVSTAQAAQHNADHFQNIPGNNAAVRQLVGVLSEASVQLLLLRSIITGDLDDRVSVFSFFSEDNANSPGSYNVGRWDVSVYDQLDGEETLPTLTYPIQVKTSKESAGKQLSYDKNGVVVIPVKETLALGREILHPGLIPSECFAEVNGTATQTMQRRLDERVGLLLDAIDQ